jgi:hypothetical protein
MTFPQSHESSSVFGLLTDTDMLEQKRPATVRQHCAGLTPIANQERPMAAILPTARTLSAQDTPRHTFDHISARDDFLRREMERGSQELLRAMIRELEAMGALA